MSPGEPRQPPGDAETGAQAKAGLRLRPQTQDDPILVRRARYQRLANLGQRIGYLFLAGSVVAFVAGFLAGFPQVAVTVTIIGLVGSCLFLPPAIVAGYAVKAAEREDRHEGRDPTGNRGRR